MQGRFFSVRGQWRRDRCEGARDPAARVDRVDHVVDLEVRGGVDRLAVLVHAGDHLLEGFPPLFRVLDGRELVAVAELDRAFEAHAAELARRPETVKNGALKLPPAIACAPRP